MLASCISVVLLQLQAEAVLSFFMMGIADVFITIRLGQADTDKKDQGRLIGLAVGMTYI